ncbi:MAG: hypothetical protein GY711_30855 [bacterium]|nr:hypothetical protein [bacterium]
MSSKLAELFAACYCTLLDELDWTLLGRLYCYEGGEHFFDEERRARILEVGLHSAGELGESLQHIDSGARASLYIGASIAELGPMLFETLVSGRAVDARNLPGAETDELNRALAATEERTGAALPRILGEPLASATDACDHVWLVSVLTDPTAFPALHDELYERHGTAEATGAGDLDLERRRAEELVRAALDRAAAPFLWTSSTDELGLVAAQCTSRGVGLEALEGCWTSPIVRDDVRVHLAARGETRDALGAGRIRPGKAR